MSSRSQPPRFMSIPSVINFSMVTILNGETIVSTSASENHPLQLCPASLSEILRPPDGQGGVGCGSFHEKTTEISEPNGAAKYRRLLGRRGRRGVVNYRPLGKT